MTPSGAESGRQHHIVEYLSPVSTRAWAMAEEQLGRSVYLACHQEQTASTDGLARGQYDSQHARIGHMAQKQAPMYSPPLPFIHKHSR